MASPMMKEPAGIRTKAMVAPPGSFTVWRASPPCMLLAFEPSKGQPVTLTPDRLGLRLFLAFTRGPLL